MRWYTTDYWTFCENLWLWKENSLSTILHPGFFLKMKVEAVLKEGTPPKHHLPRTLIGRTIGSEIISTCCICHYFILEVWFNQSQEYFARYNDSFFFFSKLFFREPADIAVEIWICSYMHAYARHIVRVPLEWVSVYPL